MGHEINAAVGRGGMIAIAAPGRVHVLMALRKHLYAVVGGQSHGNNATTEKAGVGVFARSNWKKDGYRHMYWLGLAVLFLFLAIDEGVGLHEDLSNFFENFMEPEGLLYFLWVVPYGIATAIVGLIYLRFVLNLPRRTKKLFITGMTILWQAVNPALPPSAAKRPGALSFR